MNYKISPSQLSIYLQLALLYAEKSDFELPKCKELVKEILKVNWDENAMLEIREAE